MSPRPVRLAALLVVASLSATGTAVAEPLPRPAAVVSGSVVRLGDIFTDAGDAADEAVAPAPAPGAHTTYSADWLAAIAREHHLAWTPQSAYDQATVERASRTIGSDAILARLLTEISSRQPVDNAEIQLDNPGIHLVVAAESADAFVVDGLNVDPRSGRLSAFIAPSGSTADSDRQRVTGRIIYEVDVAVPNRAIAPGETIAAQDIEHTRMHRDQLGPDMVVDAAELIGKTPRRPLRQEQPVRSGDIQAPLLIHKDQLVTIILETPSMRLTAQGKALEDGAQGAAVRVTNTQSNRIIDGTVIGPDTISVSPTPAAAAAEPTALKTATR